MVRFFLGLLLVVTIVQNGHTGNGVERISLDGSTSSKMSERAQDKLVNYLKSNCQPILLNSQSIESQLVDIAIDKVDQGVIDYTYTVDIHFFSFDQTEKETARITLTDYAGTNPAVDWVHIEKVEMTNNKICIKN